MKIFKATRKYQQWLRAELNTVEADFALKAERIADDPFTFLRGTFYRWMQVFPVACKKVLSAPSVLSVGDLHVANFGTWRNANDELVWGINDFDEAAPLPYTQDLIRLAVSVALASESQELKIGLTEACEAILDGYRASLESGGKPFILDKAHDWLRAAALRSARSPEEYWKKLDQAQDLKIDIPAEVRLALEASLPAAGLEYRLKQRWAGVGSLGRPRYTMLATFEGQPIAREAKSLLPSAALWAVKKHQGATIHYDEILKQAVRSHDPLVKVHPGWVIRRLAPDCRRIELMELGSEPDKLRMLHSMGWETGNIHLGTPAVVKDILGDMQDRKKNWLVKAARKMTDATIKDWAMWKNGSSKAEA